MKKDKLTFNITPTQRAKLQQLARDTEISISEILRRAIDEYLDRQAKDKDSN